MRESEITKATVDFVKKELQHAEAGHDWSHIERVWKLAKKIVAREPGDPFIVSLGALLHDIADAKFHGGDETLGSEKAAHFLESLQVHPNIVTHIKNIIAHISFKGGHEKELFRSPEFDIIQDADRLDAMGAIGIARAFHYGGFKNRAIYDPRIPPQRNMSKTAYRKSAAPTINHFYEKLLLLQSRMNTPTGRLLATERHEFMLNYLKQFYNEWNIE